MRDKGWPYSADVLGVTGALLPYELQSYAVLSASQPYSRASSQVGGLLYARIAAQSPEWG